MVDDLINYSQTSAVSRLTIKKDNIFLIGESFNESGLIENMAQTAALHTGYEYMLKGEVAPTGYLGSIKKLEIWNLPKLDDCITTEVNILHEFAGVTLVDVSVFDVENRLIASGQMKTVIAS